MNQIPMIVRKITQVIKNLSHNVVEWHLNRCHFLTGLTKNLKYTLPVLIAILLGSLGFSWNSAEKDKEKLVLQLMYDALTSIHYQPKVVDDSLSSQVFDFYIKL